MSDERLEQDFTEKVWEYYREFGRHGLPWRVDTSPYSILVSEIMLQQTQVARVLPKYEHFLKQFPDLAGLARAPLGEVLMAWSGLGYNRRAKYLHQAAQTIIKQHGGKFPSRASDLISLPGIGKNTAGAIMAYAYNEPAVFIETNIRTVFIHHFFDDQFEVPDTELVDLVTRTLDEQHPREWYWALMDYGSFLKRTTGSRNQQSKHYNKQPAFTGSRRQIRGKVIRLLTTTSYDYDELNEVLQDSRLGEVLESLTSEGLIQKEGGRYTL